MHFGPSPLLSAFLPALLSNQVPLNPAQTEEKPLPPPVVQHDTEAEKQLIREVRPRAVEKGRQAGPVRPSQEGCRVNPSIASGVVL